MERVRADTATWETLHIAIIRGIKGYTEGTVREERLGVLARAWCTLYVCMTNGDPIETKIATLIYDAQLIAWMPQKRKGYGPLSEWMEPYV